MLNYVFIAKMVELMLNYTANYAAYAANGNQALVPELEKKIQCNSDFLTEFTARVCNTIVRMTKAQKYCIVSIISLILTNILYR